MQAVGANGADAVPGQSQPDRALGGTGGMVIGELAIAAGTALTPGDTP